MKNENNKPLTVGQLRDFLANLPPDSDNRKVYMIDPGMGCHFPVTEIQSDYFGDLSFVIVVS